MFLSRLWAVAPGRLLRVLCLCWFLDEGSRYFLLLRDLPMILLYQCDLAAREGKVMKKIDCVEVSRSVSLVDLNHKQSSAHSR